MARNRAGASLVSRFVEVTILRIRRQSIWNGKPDQPTRTIQLSYRCVWFIFIHLCQDPLLSSNWCRRRPWLANDIQFFSHVYLAHLGYKRRRERRNIVPKYVVNWMINLCVWRWIWSIFSLFHLFPIKNRIKNCLRIDWKTSSLSLSVFSIFNSIARRRAKSCIGHPLLS